jgi:3-phenylpropionate/trans-cinnamate dioxygenase ferredoxin subunit
VTRHVVARAADLMPGTRKLVTVEGRGIVVLNIKGELFALSNTCPHKGASLCNGLLTGLVRSTKPGEYQYERAGEILRCPWHQWEFDVRTGRSYCDPRRLRLMQFPIAIEAGADVVEGPYVAETFAVKVEDEYIVLDVP